MAVKIDLSPPEILVAAQAGVMRQTENIKIGRKLTHGARLGTEWQLHVEGALGEFALAKYLNVHWPGKGKLRAPDVGEVDVRTRSSHNYDLILHDHDPDDRQFWLLTGVNGSYLVHGWIMGADGKQAGYWADPAGGRPAYFVPKHALTLVGEGVAA